METMRDATGERRPPRDAILTAHIPSFLRYGLLEARASQRTYKDLGWHVGKGLDRFEDERDHTHIDDRVHALTVADLNRPSAALRRIFRSTRHPKADLVDLIPLACRRAFLAGLYEGATGEELE